ncbi:M3 family oligoendopeptidase [Megalodesulfovibrio gigas]|uniref:Putative oligoendopeptidase, pepF/M3 family n=1 Tax=Megalodesulfovibrio gigas (strain ATCC 19364 / DSM 1382 / NCIMB 9332 / VKM B-1759) TaxID=1121448 RepID=T2G7Q6_MEGG1|nr:M3 family oligoendopeptidase [Megalodesulfovibrio gigas]AGW12224.1 putative oligoendopeptidase, pepF/M3 family [Megalodesulfovibrio gigas DSM 1382 = ATCC 19364]
MSHTPRWDLGSYFPTFDGPEYRAHLATLQADLDRLNTLAEALAPVSQGTLDAWVEFLLLDEAVLADYSHMASYLGCLTAADSLNEAYKQAQAGFARFGAAYKKVFAPVLDALRTTPDDMLQALIARPELDGAAHFIRQLKEEAGRTMAPELERLAADLAVDGISAWGRLYNEVSGRLTFRMPGQDAPVPMAQKRSLLEDPDPQIRKQALEQSNQAWEEVAHVVAASLNAIAGTRLTLNRRRGIESIIDVALFDAGMEQRDLDAMWQAVEEHLHLPWDWMRRKARCLGREQLGFQDLLAPIPQAESRMYEWDDAVGTMLGAFDRGYPALAGFCRQMLAAQRVEAEKRPGKRPGAFCTTSLRSRESRVFMTFGGRHGDVQTLAHELGHAFHGHTLAQTRPLASMYPMTLAETASTFAERLLQDAILADPAAPAGQKLGILASRCDDAAIFLCDIRMRYLFEKAFYDERAAGEVPVSRLADLMLAAQNQAFADTLAPAERDPLFWASKLHFYITGVSFYNFPYTFGYLLSLILCERGRAKGAAFYAEYEAFLRDTGSGKAAAVVRRTLGDDIGQPAFWAEAMTAIARDLEEMRRLLAAMEA